MTALLRRIYTTPVDQISGLLCAKFLETIAETLGLDINTGFIFTDFREIQGDPKF